MSYNRLFWEYENRRRRLMIRLNRRIKRIYRETAQEMPQPNQNEDVHLYTRRYRKEFERAQNEQRRRIIAAVAAGAVSVALLVRNREQEFMRRATEGKIPLSDFKTSPAVEKIINGKFYKDKFSLSDRIWNTDKKARERIDYIIREGIRNGRSSLEIARDLEQFVNPDARKDWQWRKVYPNAGNTTIDYNAQRLARTAVMHAYQEQTRQSARENPFCKGIKWHSALIHNRTCALCESRHGRIYSPDDLPLDHPNGLCTMIPVIGDLREIGTTLGQMARGTYNPKSDGSEKQKTSEQEKKQEPRKAYYDNSKKWSIVDSKGAKQVSDLLEYEVDGVLYKVDGHHVILDYGENEKRVAEIIAKKYGKEVKMVPRILFPQRISTPDYLIDGERYDLKSPTGVGKNVIYDMIKSKKRQADKFIIDLSGSEIEEDKIRRQMENIFTSKHTEFVDEIVLLERSGSIKAYMRKK